jgi:hypothetical protein
MSSTQPTRPTHVHAPAASGDHGGGVQPGMSPAAASGDHGGGVQPGLPPAVGIDAASVAGPSASTPRSADGCIPCCGHG